MLDTVSVTTASGPFGHSVKDEQTVRHKRYVIAHVCDRQASAFIQDGLEADQSWVKHAAKNSVVAAN